MVFLQMSTSTFIKNMKSLFICFHCLSFSLVFFTLLPLGQSVSESKILNLHTQVNPNLKKNIFRLVFRTLSKEELIGNSSSVYRQWVSLKIHWWGMAFIRSLIDWTLYYKEKCCLCILYQNDKSCSICVPRNYDYSTFARGRPSSSAAEGLGLTINESRQWGN